MLPCLDPQLLPTQGEHCDLRLYHRVAQLARKFATDRSQKKPNHLPFSDVEKRNMQSYRTRKHKFTPLDTEVCEWMLDTSIREQPALYSACEEVFIYLCAETKTCTALTDAERLLLAYRATKQYLEISKQSEML